VDTLIQLQECPNAKGWPRTTYQYSAAFKDTAVRLSQLPRVAVRDFAESLYIHPFMLSRWRRLARERLIVTKGVDADPAVCGRVKGMRQVKKAYERLKLEHDFLKVGHRVQFGSKAEIFAFIEHHQEAYPVRAMCRMFEVGASGYYAWVPRPPSQRTMEDASLEHKIRSSHADSRGTSSERSPAPIARVQRRFL
jgi:transposase